MTQTRTEGGFTMIEVILFLAIAGMMLAGVLVGISGSVNRQRYDEAVVSFQDFLQGQYNLVDNVRSNRPDDRPCAAPGGISVGGSQARGTSECTVVGRLISSSDGKAVVSRPLYATGASYNTDGTEEDLLNSLALRVAPIGLESDDDGHTLQWQTKVYTNPSSKNSSNRFSLLILRLPTSGLIRTYADDSVVTNLQNFWATTPSDLVLCVEPDGMITTGIELGVRVRAGGASSAAIQRTTPAEGVC